MGHLLETAVPFASPHRIMNRLINIPGAFTSQKSPLSLSYHSVLYSLRLWSQIPFKVLSFLKSITITIWVFSSLKRSPSPHLVLWLLTSLLGSHGKEGRSVHTLPTAADPTNWLQKQWLVHWWTVPCACWSLTSSRAAGGPWTGFLLIVWSGISRSSLVFSISCPLT